jgi:hypothetical protein
MLSALGDRSRRVCNLRGIMSITEDFRRGFLNTIVASHCMPPGIRHRLLRWYGVKMSPAVVVRPGFILVNSDVTIGAGPTTPAGWLQTVTGRHRSASKQAISIR